MIRGYIDSRPDGSQPHALRAIHAAAASARRFSKDKALSGRLGICNPDAFSLGRSRDDRSTQNQCRVVLFDEAEVVAFIESDRIG
jgi:hypothetical protein